MKLLLGKSPKSKRHLKEGTNGRGDRTPRGIFTHLISSPLQNIIVQQSTVPNCSGPQAEGKGSGMRIYHRRSGNGRESKSAGTTKSCVATGYNEIVLPEHCGLFHLEPLIWELLGIL